MAVSFSPIIFLLLAGSGNTGNDVVSLLPAEDYFESRMIDVTIEKMMELAGKDPVDPKTSIQQLLAIRVLAEDPAKVKKDANFAANLKVLQDIAAGKKAQDKLGFSKEYASWAVAILTDKKLPAAPAGKKLTESALDWFPEDVGLVAAVDMGGAQVKFGQSKEVRELVSVAVKQIPRRDRTEIYDVVDEMGNMRIDRAAFAYRPDPVGNEDERIYLRVSGKADHKLLSALLQKGLTNLRIENAKGANNEPITILGGQRFDPAFAIVGDSDFLMGIGKIRGDQVPKVKQILEVRDGKSASVLKGKLAGEFKKVSDQANGLIAGTIPNEFSGDFGPPRGPFGVLPSPFVLEAMRQADGIDARFLGKFGQAEDAKTFHEDFLKLRGKAMINLKLDSKDMPFPVEPILNTLKSIKMEPKESDVSATMRVTNENISAMISGLTKMAKDLPKRD